jgi:hypothetical protein
MRNPIIHIPIFVLLSGLMATSVAWAGPQPKCLIKINSGKAAAGTGKTLARKIAAAQPGDTIHLGNRCSGNFTITKDLNLVGDLVPGDTFLLGGSAGTVLTIGAGATVSIAQLGINGGAASIGGGIVNDGDLTLGEGALVFGNDDGGGVFNNGTLRMTGDATISVNFSFNSGGGLYNTGTAIVEDDAAIRDNTSAAGPGFAVLGGGIFNDGSLTLRGNASVRNNFATNGGGVFNDGTLTLEDAASITDNRASANGGGISVGGNSIISVDPAWTGTTCDPANSPNDYDASNGGAACP